MVQELQKVLSFLSQVHTCAHLVVHSTHVAHYLHYLIAHSIDSGNIPHMDGQMYNLSIMTVSKGSSPLDSLYHVPKLSLLVHTSLLAIPGAPRNVRAAEASERIDNNCIILVTWDPPTNIEVSDIDHYTITVPSRNIVEDGSSAIFSLRIHNCHRNDSIQVAAVNRFGCVGENSLQTQPSLLDDIARTTGSTTSTPTGSTSDSGKD